MLAQVLNGFAKALRIIPEAAKAIGLGFFAKQIRHGNSLKAREANFCQSAGSYDSGPGKLVSSGSYSGRPAPQLLPMN